MMRVLKIRCFGFSKARRDIERYVVSSMKDEDLEYGSGVTQEFDPSRLGKAYANAYLRGVAREQDPHRPNRFRQALTFSMEGWPKVIVSMNGNMIYSELSWFERRKFIKAMRRTLGGE